MRTYTYPLVFNVLTGIAVTGSPLWLLHWKKGQRECFFVLFTATGYKGMLRFRLFFFPVLLPRLVECVDSSVHSSDSCRAPELGGLRCDHRNRFPPAP